MNDKAVAAVELVARWRNDAEYAEAYRGPENADARARLRQCADELETILAELGRGAGEPVATLRVSSFRGHLENTAFDYHGSLPDGSYQLFTRPPVAGLAELTDEVVMQALIAHTPARDWDAIRKRKTP